MNRPETSFYRFPGITVHPEQYELWLKAIDRVKEDGSPWVPKAGRHAKRSLVCSDHFVSGRPRYGYLLTLIISSVALILK